MKLKNLRFCENSNAEKMKLNEFYLFRITVAGFCQNKHFIAVADHKVGKHYVHMLSEVN